MKVALIMKFWHDGQENSSRVINVNYTWEKLKQLTSYLKENGVDCDCELFDFSPDKIIQESTHIPFGLGEYRLAEKQNIILKRKQESDYFFAFDCDAFFHENDYTLILNIIRELQPNWAYSFDMAKLDGVSTEKVLSENYNREELEFSYAFTGDKVHGPFGVGHRGGLGGVYLVDTKMLTQNGGFDENYIGWGGEDNDALGKITQTGFVNPIKSFAPYHLQHFTDWGSKAYTVRFPSYTIGITTFSKRIGYLSALIPQIRKHNGNKILLCINGEKDGVFSDDYRNQVLRLCVEYDNVYPIFFPETRGLAKMWNTIISHSDEENILMLGDDIEIHSDNIFTDVHEHIKGDYYSGLTRINGSYAHFLINKKVMNELGYFDERLLGFGEEDGDITWRFIDKYKKPIGEMQTGGVVNIVSDIRHDYIKPGVGKYSLYNRKFMFEEKYVCGPEYEGHPVGMFGQPCKMVIETQSALPYEGYFLENKIKL